MTQNPNEDAMRPTHRAVWTVGALLASAAWFWGSPKLGLSVAVGCSVAGANLWVLSRTVRNLMDGLSFSWGAVAAGKFLLLMAVTYVALSSRYIEALGFALGIAALPLGIVFSGLFLSPSRPLTPSSVRPAPVETDHA
jgi:hypothetical protein